MTINSDATKTQFLVLLTGATGYIGGRLVPVLEQMGCQIRCLARRPEYLKPRVAPGTGVVEGNVLDMSSLRAAMDGVDTAYYLVHSMGSSGAFEEEDRGQPGTLGQRPKKVVFSGSYILEAFVPRIPTSLLI